MKTSKVFLALFFSIASLSPILAQKEGENHQEHRAQMKNQKIAYLTELLNLTSQEAEKFWPAYNAMYDELRKAKSLLREKSKIAKEKQNEMTDKIAEDFANAHIAHLKTEAEIKSLYHQKFAEILSIQKVALLYLGERNFKKEMMKGRQKGKTHPHYPIEKAE